MAFKARSLSARLVPAKTRAADLAALAKVSM